jgi:type VI secretion system protein ImpC
MAFRQSEDARYVALTLPRVLARPPYGSESEPVKEFNFEEFVDGKDHDKYLWMNAAWAYAARVTAAYAQDGWPARTRGVEGGGLVEDLPVPTFRTGEGDLAVKCPTEVVVTERRDNELGTLGFLPLDYRKNSNVAVFMGAQSCQKPEMYYDKWASENAQLSARFNYILCVARFAHYFKVMVRDKVGKFMEAKECENWLNEWIQNYVVANPELVTEEEKARRPLQDARVTVVAVKGVPGYYKVTAMLRPHYHWCLKCASWARPPERGVRLGKHTTRPGSAVSGQTTKCRQPVYQPLEAYYVAYLHRGDRGR